MSYEVGLGWWGNGWVIQQEGINTETHTPALQWSTEKYVISSFTSLSKVNHEVKSNLRRGKKLNAAVYSKGKELCELHAVAQKQTATLPSAKTDSLHCQDTRDNKPVTVLICRHVLLLMKYLSILGSEQLHQTSFLF